MNKKVLPPVLLLIDIDDTIADLKHREHLLPNWNEFFKACDGDTPRMEIINVLRKYIDNQNTDEFKYIFLTGRSGLPEVIEKTSIWLNKLGFDGKRVKYRKTQDFSKSFEYKVRSLSQYLEKHEFNPNLNVIIIDDDNKVIQAFKELGHTAILVNKEDYATTAQELDNILNEKLIKTISSSLKVKP